MGMRLVFRVDCGHQDDDYFDHEPPFSGRSELKTNRYRLLRRYRCGSPASSLLFLRCIFDVSVVQYYRLL